MFKRTWSLSNAICNTKLLGHPDIFGQKYLISLGSDEVITQREACFH